MDEKKLKAAVDSLQVLLEGEIQIKKECGDEKASVHTNLMPLTASYLLINAFVEMIYQAGHVEGALRIKLDEESLRKMMAGISELVIQDILKMEREVQ